MGKKGHIGVRDNDSGKFRPKTDGDRYPKTTTREIVPNPGHGDTGRYDKPKPPSKK